MVHFSIIIPCFNAQDTITQTLRSIQVQSHTDWEVICVDDGSTDRTLSTIDNMCKADPRIRLAFNPMKGPSSARNYGAMDLARGDIIAFCDADDFWVPRKLEDLAEAFSDDTVDAAYSQVAFFADSTSDVSTYSTVPQDDLTISMLLGENPVCTMSNIAVRRDRFQDTGGLDPDIVHNEDLEWLVRCVGQGLRVMGIPSCHTYYRASPFGLSSNLKAMAIGRASVLKTAAEYGVSPDKASHAIYQRYLARRALRLGQGRSLALRFALIGLFHSPTGFFNSPRRGFLTLLGAVCAVFLPRRISCSLFSR